MKYQYKMSIPIDKKDYLLVRELKEQGVNIKKLFLLVLWSSIDKPDDFSELSQHCKNSIDDIQIIPK